MTQSMEEVIKPGDIVVSIKRFKRANYERGDIVAFQKDRNRTTFVKRIVAIPRDTLWIERDFLLVNGTKIPHDPIFEMMIKESNDADSTNYYSAKVYLNYF